MRYGTLDGMQSSEAVATAVGRNVRALRQQRRMTIDALAAASGVSRGTVIQVETARGNPSIGTLCNLAAALRVGVASLVDGDAAAAGRRAARGRRGAAVDERGGQQRGVPHRHRPARRRRAVGLDAAARRRLRGRGAPDRHPGGALGARRARWPCGWAAADQVLDTGDTVLFQAHAPHRYACAGDEPVRFVMVVLQPGDAGLVPPTAIAEAESRPMTASPAFHDGESPIP